MTRDEINQVTYMMEELIEIMHRLEEEHKEPKVRKRLDTIIGKMYNLVHITKQED